MSATEEKLRVTLVTACMTAPGLPAFAMTEVEVTQDEIDNGIHYYLAEADLLQAGYEEPFVHFTMDEAPPFLFPAVKEFLRHAVPEGAPMPVG
jgi:hypothetical protein